MHPESPRESYDVTLQVNLALAHYYLGLPLKHPLPPMRFQPCTRRSLQARRGLSIGAGRARVAFADYRLCPGDVSGGTRASRRGGALPSAVAPGPDCRGSRDPWGAWFAASVGGARADTTSPSSTAEKLLGARHEPPPTGRTSLLALSSLPEHKSHSESDAAGLGDHNLTLLQGLPRASDLHPSTSPPHPARWRTRFPSASWVTSCECNWVNSNERRR
jgi:hypothetical protein